MSDTPRSDEEKSSIPMKTSDGKITWIETVSYELSCELERELSEMHATALEYARSSDQAHSELSQYKQLAGEMHEALRNAQLFIQNGTEYGYIRIPDKDTPDPAKLTPKIIGKALAKFRNLEEEGKQ